MRRQTGVFSLPDGLKKGLKVSFHYHYNYYSIPIYRPFFRCRWEKAVFRVSERLKVRRKLKIGADDVFKGSISGVKKASEGWKKDFAQSRCTLAHVALKLILSFDTGFLGFGFFGFQLF
jgi:hypothetical protein